MDRTTTLTDPARQPGHHAALEARAFRAYRRGDLAVAEQALADLKKLPSQRLTPMLSVAQAVCLGQPDAAWDRLDRAVADGVQPQTDLELTLAFELADATDHHDDAARWSEALLLRMPTLNATRVFFRNVASSNQGVSKARLLHIIEAGGALPVFGRRVCSLAYMNELSHTDAAALLDVLAARGLLDDKAKRKRRKLVQSLQVGARENAIRIERAENPEGVLLKFSGLGPPRSTDIPAGSALGELTNWTKIVLYDPEVLSFMDGIEQLGRGFDATLARLAAMLDELGPRGGPRVITTASIGGLGGLQYAARLKVDRVIAFSPVTVAHPDVLHQLGDRRAPSRFERARRKFADAPWKLDAKQALEAAETLPDIRVIYGKDRTIDARHAERLRGISGVTLHPLGGVDKHYSSHFLRQAGLYSDVLNGEYSGLDQTDWASLQDSAPSR